MDNLIFKPDSNTVTAKPFVKDGVQHNPLGQVASEDHKAVSVAWSAHCKPLLDVRAEIEADALNKRDELVPESEVRLSGDLKAKTYPFTRNGLTTLNSFTDIPNAMLDYLYEKHFWADYADYANNELDIRAGRKRIGKNFLLRLRAIDGVDYIRGIMSEKYGIIDHMDVMNAIFRSLPGGKDDALCSSYYNDGDTMGGNVILPDYIKKRSDSEYGCGFKFGNSEIKAKTFTVAPYLYRAIDATGYIWSKRDATISISLKHFGKIEFENIKKLTKAAIETALTQGENMIVLLDCAKQVTINNGLRIIASLTRDYKMSIKEGKEWHKAYLNSDHAGTAFGIVNALSAAGDVFGAETKEMMEMLAVKMLAPTLTTTQSDIEKRWKNIESRSQLLDAKIVGQYEYKGLN